MKLGLCCAIHDADFALEIGFDYVELPAHAIDQLTRLSDLAGLPILATNLFFPGGLHIYSERDRALEYARSVVPKAARLGVEVMVVGSGNARRTDGDPAEALEAFASLVAEIAALARPLGVTIAPEALRAEETNVGNDPRELIAALRRANPDAAYTADLYHHLAAGVDQLPAKPTHVHVSARDRTAPKADDSDVQAFATQLATFGYHERASLEAGWTREDLPGHLANLRALFPN
jgi:sugar phosphate isomerase/epimerase